MIIPCEFGECRLNISRQLYCLYIIQSLTLCLYATRPYDRGLRQSPAFKNCRQILCSPILLYYVLRRHLVWENFVSNENCGLDTSSSSWLRGRMDVILCLWRPQALKQYKEYFPFVQLDESLLRVQDECVKK